MLTFREVMLILAKRQTERRVGPTPPIAEILVIEAMEANPPTTALEMDVDELRSHDGRYAHPLRTGHGRRHHHRIVSFHDVAKAVLEERNMETSSSRPTSRIGHHRDRSGAVKHLRRFPEKKQG
jgi:hypothetical protein